MMRFYNFCGRRLDDNELVFGDLSTIGEVWSIVNTAGIFPVKKLSVAVIITDDDGETLYTDCDDADGIARWLKLR